MVVIMEHNFVCATCGMYIAPGHCIMIRDNFLVVKYFDDNKSNRFCSSECLMEALFAEEVDDDEVPLDSDEEDEASEEVT